MKGELDNRPKVMNIGDIIEYNGGRQDEVVSFTDCNGMPALRVKSKENSAERIVLLAYASHLINMGVWRLRKRQKRKVRLRV